MINANVTNKGSTCKVYAKGSVDEIAAESAEIISSIYAQMKVSAPAEASLFKTMVLMAVNDPRSPMWHKRPADIGIAIAFPNGGEQDG